jgi:hypothetical protein
MKTLASFVVGFVAGWGVRAVVDSSRDLIVSVTAAAHGAAETARRYAVIEREHLEDLVAEGKAQWEAQRRRRAEEAAARADLADDPVAGGGATP